MDAKNEDPKPERGGLETQQSQEVRPTSKLRDLKPEKDPMGARAVPQRGDQN